MEEPPIREDEFIGEPPEYIEPVDGSAADLDAQIESHVAAVEQRDADHFSHRVEQTHPAPRPSRRPGRQPRRDRQHGQRRGQGARRAARDDDDQQQQDGEPQGRSRSIRAGLILTIVLTAISVVAVLVIFASNGGAPSAPPNIEIKTRTFSFDSYPTIQPPAAATPLPAVKQTRLRLPRRSS